jgi:choline kinase
VRALQSNPDPVAVSADRNWRAYWDLRMEDPRTDAESFRVDDAGLVLDLGRPVRNLDEVQGQYMGLIKVRADHLPRLVEVYQSMDRAALYDGKAFDQMYMTAFLRHLIALGWPVRAVPVDGGWLEVDTVQDLRLYEALYRDARLADIYDPDCCA